MLRSELLHRLQREWEALAHRPSVLRRARRWQLDVSFRSLDELLAATGYRPQGAVPAHTPTAAADALLARLLVLATDDELAARVVLHRLIPGLLSLARKWQRRPDAPPDAIDDLVAVAWEVIRAGDVGRRVEYVVPRLLHAVEYRAYLKQSRRRLELVHTSPHHLDLPVEWVPVDGRTELAELVAAGRGVLSEGDLRLVGLLVRGCTPPQIADELKVSIRTVANRRDAVVHRLRQVALAA